MHELYLQRTHDKCMNHNVRITVQKITDLLHVSRYRSLQLPLALFTAEAFNWTSLSSADSTDCMYPVDRRAVLAKKQT